MDIKNTIFVNQAFASAQRKAESYRHEFIMPEHLLSAIIEQEPFIHTLQDTFYNYVELSISLENYLTEEVDTVPDNVEYELGLSVQLSSLLQHAYTVTEYSSAEELDVPHLIQGLLQLEDSWACHFLKEAVGGDLPDFLSLLITHYEEAELAEEAGGTPSPDEQEKTEPWRNYVTCLNDHLAGHNPLIGREMELERTIQVLCRKEKNNPLHVGEPGVGKTALAYGLAARIEAGNVPERPAGLRIYELDLGSLLAGTQYRGDFEKRLKSIMEGIGREGNAIVYIDEIHNLIGAGRTGEGSMDASNMLKPYLETGAIRFIGSTTYDEYNRYFARSKGLVRRFQQIDILEPNIEEAIHIVEGLKEKYETYHGVTYEPDVIPYAVKANARYISDRFLPDKAIDLVDEAASRLRLEMNSVPEEIDTLDRRVRQLEIEREAIRREKDKERVEHLTKEIEELKARDAEMRAKWQGQRDLLKKIQSNKDKIEALKIEAQQAERQGDYGKVAEIRYGKIQEAEKEIAAFQEEYKLASANGSMIKEEVDAQDVAEVVSRWTGIPVTRMLASEREKLLHMEDELHKRVIGQEQAIAAISDAVRRSRAGLNDPRKPIGSFIFLGTTGVGKTELAKALAEFLFNDDSMMTRIDMSEYQERHSVSRLVGAPPGYVGYDEGGQLTEAVRRKPYSVVLLDEIEKAHPDVFNILLQVLDDGRLTDNKGRTVDFRNTIIIMTSNMGSQVIQENFAEAFNGEKLAPEVVEKTRRDVIDLLKQQLKPEFLNRIDEIVMFEPLTRRDIGRIVDIQLGVVRRMLAENGIRLEYTDKAREWIAAAGYDPLYGARPVKRTIQRYVVNDLSKRILAGDVNREQPIRIDADDKGLTFAN